jgi:hypothetical protein
MRYETQILIRTERWLYGTRVSADRIEALRSEPVAGDAQRRHSYCSVSNHVWCRAPGRRYVNEGVGQGALNTSRFGAGRYVVPFEPRQRRHAYFGTVRTE